MIEDYGAFLLDFGETVTVNATPIMAIVDSPYTLALEVAGTAWSLTCISSDVSTVDQGDPVVARGVSYTVVGIEPDGTGFTTLRMERS